MHRRVFLTLAGAACASSAIAEPPPASLAPPTLRPSDLLGASGDANFLAWLNDFYAREIAAGWSRTVLDHELSGLSPDPRVTAQDATQPEFAVPVSDYVNRQITAAVIVEARRKRDAVAALPQIEKAYGVPADILVSIWRMESAFGVSQGDFDVVRSFATLAAAGRRRAWAESEIDACLKIISTGAATRGRLRGSWAGAMGQTQILPSTFLSTAVAADGAGKPDIWGSPADALASAASLLAKSGWARGQGWAREVKLPKGFDLSLTEGPREVPSWWEDKGVRRADGRPWPAVESAAAAQLLLPSGAAGPAFLALQNHFTIRAYNNSLAYALSVGLLADRVGGAPPLVAAWPHETPLSLTDRLEAQTALAKLGFNPGATDGVVGFGTRQALRAWQKARGLPADGYLSPDMVKRLKTDMAAAGTSAKPG